MLLRKYRLYTLCLALIVIVIVLLQLKEVSVFKQSGTHNACGTSPDMVLVEGGSFTMGAGAIYPEETPSLVTTVNSFYMNRYEVTNAEFAEFVGATGYVTVAERQPSPDIYPDLPAELLYPGSVVFTPEASESNNLSKLWQYKKWANWKQPLGPNSSIDGKEWFPVVHIALEDAKAYAEWKGHRLPTEAEYEYASRGGLDGAQYESGDTLKKDGKHIANTWQGFFPYSNSQEDGFKGLAPVGCYPANLYGLHDMIGNVWEWTQSTYYPNHYTDETLPETMPTQGYDNKQPGVPVAVVKGGSFLCAENFCMRYRPAARHAQDTGLGASHIGFRTVKDIDKIEFFNMR